MNTITIERTDNSPKVILDFEKSYILFEGKCYPENTFDFFEPLLDWLKEYFENNYKEGTIVDIKLTYFNSATTQVLFDILDIFQDADVKSLTVNWFYDANNENGMEDYEDFSEEFLDLNIVAKTL